MEIHVTYVLYFQIHGLNNNQTIFIPWCQSSFNESLSFFNTVFVVFLNMEGTVIPEQ